MISGPINATLSQGDLVKEAKPIRLDFYQEQLTSDGPFTSCGTGIYMCKDSNNTGAPRYENSELCTTPLPFNMC